jgi:ribose/xylose/arabinose/galactoside ABC-type transport system permease subunit
MRRIRRKASDLKTPQLVTSSSSPAVKTDRGAARQNLIFICAVAVLLLLLSILVQGFLTTYNIFNVIIKASIYGTMAVGITFVLITGGIDISLPAVMTAGAVVGVTYMARTGNPVLGCVIILAVCMFAGLVNGIAVTILNMPPLIVTLATSAIAQGFAVWFTNFSTVTGIPDGLITFFRGYVWVIPVYAIFFLVIVGLAQFALQRTIYGRWLYFVGINKNAARVSGVPVKFTITIAYVLCSLSAGLAAIMLSTQIGSAQPGMGQQSMVLDIISSAVIGGVSISGGMGTVFGAAIGSVFISLISNIMNLSSVEFYLTEMLKGLIIILATAFDKFRKQ